MNEPTLYQIDQLADDEDRPQEVWQDRGLGYKEFVGVLVPVERCEHGNIDSHVIGFEDAHDAQGYAVPVLCPGAGIGGDDEC